MKKILVYIWTIGVIIFALRHLAQGQNSNLKQQNLRVEKKDASMQEGWRTQMQNFRADLSELLPLTADPETFNASENAILIQNVINKLTQTTQILTHKMVEIESDPTMTYVAGAFEENLAAIQENLKKGRRDYARYLLLNTVSYCIECHTRTKEQPELMTVKDDQIVKKLSPLNRVEYLVAIRRFSEALQLIESSLKQDPPEVVTFAAEKMLRYGFAIAVKYNQSPEQTLSLIHIIETSKNIPHFLKKNEKYWKQSTLNWQKQNRAKPLTPAQVLLIAGKLIKEGGALNAKAGSLHAADIDFLRANSMLIQLLKNSMTKEQTAQALGLIGESYEDMTDSLFWSMHHHYYEACIRQWPHSEVAQKCFRKFEQSVYYGFSGSSGTYLPTRIIGQIKELKTLSDHK